jgi:hypothetical protein
VSAARFLFLLCLFGFGLTGGAAPRLRDICGAADIKKPGGLMCLPGLGIVYEGYFTCFW